MVLNWEQFSPPGDIWQSLETCLVNIAGGGVLLASGWERPGTQPNRLQCTGQPPTAMNYPDRDVN